MSHCYTCQLFLRYKREIFILGPVGVLGFLKTTRSFPKIPKEARSLPKTSEVCRSLPKANSLPVLFTSKIRDREEGIAIYSFYTWFSFLTWVWVNIFLEIVSSKTATTHIFQSGVRNWPAGVSRRESWQVYIVSTYFSYYTCIVCNKECQMNNNIIGTFVIQLYTTIYYLPLFC